MRVSTTYGEKFSVRLTVRIIPTHEKDRHCGRYLSHGMAIYAAYRTSQPPDYRTYSPEVTSLRSNLPVHRSVCAWKGFHHADLIIISDIQRNVKTFFSVFHSFFEIFLAVRRCTRQRGKCPPPGHFPLRYLIPDQAASAYYMVYRSGTKNTGMLCTPVFLIIYVLRCPAWPSVRRSSPGTLHPSGIPAPGW